MRSTNGAMLLIVTRPAAQAAAWVDALQALGQAAQALPLIDIAPVADPAPVQAAWAQLADQALVMFVSANAVAHFMRHARGAWPAGVRAGSTGPGTSAALRAAAVPAELIVEPAADATQWDSEALWARLSGDDWRGRRVLVVRGEDGRDWLAQAMSSRGARVHFVSAYRRCAPALAPAQARLLAQSLAAPRDHLWLFSSSQAVGHLQALVPGADWRRSGAVASHPRIAAATRSAGFGDVRTAPPEPAAMAALAAQWQWASIQSDAP